MNKKIIIIIAIILIIALGITLTVCFKNNSNQENTQSDASEQINNNLEENVMISNNTNNKTVENINEANISNNINTNNIQTQTEQNNMQTSNNNIQNQSEFKIKATVNGQTLYATLENNSTSRDFVKKLPITLPMMDLYDREMCYRFEESFATDNLQSNSYEIGEIAYWVPGHSFVILYEQNGERFERQKLGKFDSSVDIFKTTGDVDVRFELAD